MNIKQCARVSLLCVTCFGTTCLAVLADNNQDDWKVGFASVRITPEQPVRMAGYGSKQRKQVSQGVASDLYAKAIAIEDGGGSAALLVTTDVIGLTRNVSDPLYARISAETGLSRDQILINSSHTHTGPVIGLDESHLQYLESPDHVKGTIAYTRKLCDKVVRVCVDAMKEKSRARMSWGLGVASFVMNRREFTERGVRLGVNPRGLSDRGVPVLKIETADGTLKCIVIGAACHNTTLTGNDMLISADYAGYAQEYLERQLPDTQAMFVQGCGGDANPFPRGSEEIARLHGRALGEEVLRVIKTDLKRISGSLKTVLSPISLPLQTQFSAKDLDDLDRAGGATRTVAKEVREKMDAGDKLPAAYESHVALWQIGKDLTLVALPGEVVVDYVRLIEDAIGPRDLWVSAYNHDVFGYLPSARVLREGGYEKRGIYAGGFGIFSPAVEQAVIAQVRDMAVKAGRLPMAP